MLSGSVGARRRRLVHGVAIAAAVWLALAVVLWSAGELGALAAHRRWGPTDVADAVLLVRRVLLGGEADPAAAWPPAARPLLPGAPTYYGLAAAVLALVGAPLAAIVLRARRPAGALGWGIPRPPRPGFARRAEIRQVLGGHGNRQPGAPAADRAPAPPAPGRAGVDP